MLPAPAAREEEPTFINPFAFESSDEEAVPLDPASRQAYERSIRVLRRAPPRARPRGRASSPPAALSPSRGTWSVVPLSCRNLSLFLEQDNGPQGILRQPPPERKHPSARHLRSGPRSEGAHSHESAHTPLLARPLVSRPPSASQPTALRAPARPAGGAVRRPQSRHLHPPHARALVQRRLGRGLPRLPPLRAFPGAARAQAHPRLSPFPRSTRRRGNTP